MDTGRGVLLRESGYVPFLIRRRALHLSATNPRKPDHAADTAGIGGCQCACKGPTVILHRIYKPRPHRRIHFQTDVELAIADCCT